MQNPLMQTIEALAKEKGIEAETIITAIEDAVLTASRKYYKTNENLKTRFNQETGQVDLFAIKHIVVGRRPTTPTEISLKEAQELYGEEAEVDMEIEFPKRTDVLGRIAAQTAKQVIFQKVREAEREQHLRRVQRPRRRSHQQHGQAVRERRPDRRDRPRRSGAAAQGAVARRKLHARASASAR